MSKKEVKQVEKKISKKDFKKEIEIKLETALLGFKADFDEETFKDLIKKTGKLFITSIPKKDIPAVKKEVKKEVIAVKKIKVKKTDKVAIVEKSK